MKLTDATKAAIRRIVETLPHLKAQGDSAIPAAQRADVEAIRRATKNSGSRDPQIEAAEEWAVAEIEKTLAEPAETSDAPPPIGGSAEPGVSQSATIEGGGVALHEKPIGELSDEEVEKLNAPKEGQ